MQADAIEVTFLEPTASFNTALFEGADAKAMLKWASIVKRRDRQALEYWRARWSKGVKTASGETIFPVASFEDWNFLYALAASREYWSEHKIEPSDARLPNEKFQSEKNMLGN